MEELFRNFALGFQTAVTLQNLLFVSSGFCRHAGSAYCRAWTAGGDCDAAARPPSTCRGGALIMLRVIYRHPYGGSPPQSW